MRSAVRSRPQFVQAITDFSSSSGPLEKSDRGTTEAPFLREGGRRALSDRNSPRVFHLGPLDSGSGRDRSNYILRDHAGVHAQAADLTLLRGASVLLGR